MRLAVVKQTTEPTLDAPQVRDPALLEQAKARDKTRFSAEKIGGHFTVIRIEPA